MLHRARRFLLFLTFVATLFPGCFIFALDPNKAITQYTVNVWQPEQGLPSNNIVGILQSKSGYIWLASEEGLIRFDGVHFRVFNKRNTAEITNPSITALFEDSEKNLWIGSYGGGLLRFKDKKFEAFTSQDGLSNNQVISIHEDRRGNLWIGTEGGGLNCLSNGKFKVFTTKEGLFDDTVFSIHEDREGTLWIGTRGGLNIIRNGNIQPASTPVGYIKHSVRAIDGDESGNIFLGTSEGLIVLNHGKIQTYTTGQGLGTNKIWCVKVDRQGSVWIGTDGGGLARLRNGVISTFAQKEGLSNDLIRSIYEDQEGSLWVGTNLGGLNCLKDSKFTIFSSKEGLSSDIVWSIYEDSKNNLWISTDIGLNKYVNGTFTHFTSENGLSTNRILSLYEDHNSNLWVGTHSGGLNRLNNGKFKTFTTKDGLSGDIVMSIYPDRSENLWIGTSDGLNRYHDGKFTVFKTKDGLSSDRIRPILETSEGIWIGTRNGLNLYKDGKFKEFSITNGLSNNFITSLYGDSNQNLWIGTVGGGLNRYKDGKFSSYTTKQGLFDDSVYQILDDGRGRLWMTCNKDVFSVPLQELEDFAAGKINSIHSTSYGIADSMKSAECVGGPQPAGWKTKDGRLWFPTTKGIAMIDPGHIKFNNRPPQLILEEIVVDDKPISIPEDNFQATMKLPPGKGRLEFRYTGLSYLAPSRVQFKYKLEGFDEDWINAGTRRVAYYTNIPPGKYRFQVTACNNDGVWNKSGIFMGLYLQPHFYQTTWFYLLCGLAAVLIGWSIVRYRVSKIIEIERVRTRIATDLHDDIGSGLSQIAILSEVARRKIDHSESHIAQELKNIAGASRELVDSMSDIVWAVNPGKDQLADLIQRMRRFASDVLTARNINFRFESSITESERKLTPDIRRHVFLIFKEAINNMIRHSNGTSAEITLQIEGNCLVLQVSDNGKGFDLPETTSGQGVRNMRKRAKEMNGQLNIKSIPGEGTTVSLRIPLTRHFFQIR